MYNIKMVAKLLDISASTIRAWENRYQVVSPGRNEGGHRLYSDQDVEDLRWLKLQTSEKGQSISQAAIMLKKKKTIPPIEVIKAKAGLSYNYKIMEIDLYGTLMDLNVENANRIVDLGFSMYQFDEMLHQVFVPLMIRVGDEWESGSISVAQEHLVSQFILQRCMQFFRLFPINSRLPRVIAACPTDEHHQVGLLLFSLFLRRKGFDVIYLGGNTPVQGIGDLIKDKQLEWLCISLSDPGRVKNSEKYVETILGQAPQVKIVLGGRGFHALSSKHPYRAYLIGDQIGDWESWYQQNFRLLD